MSIAIDVDAVRKYISKVNVFFQCFTVALVLHVLCFLVWGTYYGEYLDNFFNAYIDGTFTAGYTKPLFYNYGILPGSSQLLAWAYNAWPTVNWYGLTRQGFMLLSTTGLVWLFIFVWHGYRQHKWLVAAAILFVCSFWSYHVVWPRISELAFLTCGIGIFGIVASYTALAQETMTKLRSARVFFVLLVLLSVHIRVESALMGIAVFAPVGLWVIKDRKALMGFLKISLVVVPVFVGTYMVYLWASGPAEKLFQESRVYTYTLWDFGQESQPFNLSSAADSVKLEASQQFFIADEEGMSPEFYRRIGVIPREKELGAIGTYFDGFDARINRALEIWRYYSERYTSLFAHYLIVLSICSCLLIFLKHWKQLLLLFFSQFWLWLALFGVTVFMKMELRVFAPLISLSVILMVLAPILSLKSRVATIWPRALVWCLIVVLVVSATYKLVEVHHSAQGYKIGRANVRAFKDELKGIQENRIVVFNSLAWLLLYDDVFDINEFASNSNIISIDNGELFMYPEFKQSMLECCNGYKPDDIAKYLQANKERVVFVSYNDRMDLLQRYFETVYNIPFRTKPAFPESVLSNPKGSKMIPGYTDHIDYSHYVFE